MGLFGEVGWGLWLLADAEYKECGEWKVPSQQILYRGITFQNLEEESS